MTNPIPFETYPRPLVTRSEAVQMLSHVDRFNEWPPWATLDQVDYLLEIMISLETRISPPDLLRAESDPRPLRAEVHPTGHGTQHTWRIVASDGTIVRYSDHPLLSRSSAVSEARHIWALMTSWPDDATGPDWEDITTEVMKGST